MLNVSIQWICRNCKKLNYGINSNGKTVCGNCGEELFNDKYMPNCLTDDDYELLDKLLY